MFEEIGGRPNIAFLTDSEGVGVIASVCLQLSPLDYTSSSDVRHSTYKHRDTVDHQSVLMQAITARESLNFAGFYSTQLPHSSSRSCSKRISRQSPRSGAVKWSHRTEPPHHRERLKNDNSSPFYAVSQREPEILLYRVNQVNTKPWRRCRACVSKRSGFWIRKALSLNPRIL